MDAKRIATLLVAASLCGCTQYQVVCKKDGVTVFASRGYGVPPANHGGVWDLPFDGDAQPPPGSDCKVVAW